ncbi:hypothetical protein [Methylobacterium nodulans]|uniref:Uncharacterized protein n=1 Tax=Methylobacterium nodulans (strain LMG 21967 / CNCM I-2342 / ORS 2060) TaxID=460265 RepID=B8ID85_METNO|nr:hypothetical protein [Methylobacterium nodulans]ACL61251.1 conserved hypothetical protein [Methylobacterium nodulans ORS 2060]
MTAALDRRAFYDAVRQQPFGGSLTQSQVDGMNAMLDMAPPDLLLTALACCFATAFWETGGAMIPRTESLNYTSAARIKAVWPSRFPTEAAAAPYVRNPKALAIKVYGGRLGNAPAPSTDGWDFRGMGLVQSTGKDNAQRASVRLRRLGYLTPEQDLVSTPALMLDDRIAAAMLFIGLSEGWYTGKKLAHYFGPQREDPTNARAMVNPDANGLKVAGYYRSFKRALEAAGYRPGTTATSQIEPSLVVQPQVGAPLAPMAPIPPVPVNTAKPTLADIAPPLPPVVEEPPPAPGMVRTGGLGAWLKSLFGRKAA